MEISETRKYQLAVHASKWKQINYQSLFIAVRFDWAVVTEYLWMEDAKVTCVWKHELSSARARMNDDSNLQYYTTA